MREIKFTQDLYTVRPAGTDSACGPFADTVNGKDCSLGKGEGKKALAACER